MRRRFGGRASCTSDSPCGSIGRYATPPPCRHTLAAHNIIGTHRFHFEMACHVHPVCHPLLHARSHHRHRRRASRPHTAPSSPLASTLTHRRCIPCPTCRGASDGSHVTVWVVWQHESKLTAIGARSRPPAGAASAPPPHHQSRCGPNPIVPPWLPPTPSASLTTCSRCMARVSERGLSEIFSPPLHRPCVAPTDAWWMHLQIPRPPERATRPSNRHLLIALALPPKPMPALQVPA